MVLVRSQNRILRANFGLAWKQCNLSIWLVNFCLACNILSKVTKRFLAKKKKSV